MPTHVALLRGINVGGRNRVAMADLRDVVTGLGHAEVATYIQSGNVVFTSEEPDTDRLAADLGRSIDASLGVQPGVVVLSRAELSQVVADNPYPDETNPKFLHAVFRRGEVGGSDVAAVADAQQRARDKGSNDEASVVGRTVYLRTPDGLGRSELAAQLNKKGAPGSGSGTTRNWATVTTLLALLGD